MGDDRHMGYDGDDRHLGDGSHKPICYDEGKQRHWQI